MFVCLFVRVWTVCLSEYLSVCLSVCLSLCLSVCLSVSVIRQVQNVIHGKKAGKEIDVTLMRYIRIFVQLSTL